MRADQTEGTHLSAEHLGTESFIFLRKGKKTYHLVRVV